MPHVSISVLTGRSLEAKTRMAQRIREVVSEELAVRPELISVSVEDISDCCWQEHLATFAETMIISPCWQKEKEKISGIPVHPDVSVILPEKPEPSGNREVLLPKTVLHQAVRLTSPANVHTASLKQ